MEIKWAIAGDYLDCPQIPPNTYLENQWSKILPKSYHTDYDGVDTQQISLTATLRVPCLKRASLYIEG